MEGTFHETQPSKYVVVAGQTPGHSMALSVPRHIRL